MPHSLGLRPLSWPVSLSLYMPQASLWHASLSLSLSFMPLCPLFCSFLPLHLLLLLKLGLCPCHSLIRCLIVWASGHSLGLSLFLSTCHRPRCGMPLSLSLYHVCHSALLCSLSSIYTSPLTPN